MKKIEVVIRRTRFEETKEALLENGVEWFSYVDVRGSGHARNRRVYRGVMYETDIIERMMLILIVRDELCDKAYRHDHPHGAHGRDRRRARLGVGHRPLLQHPHGTLRRADQSQAVARRDGGWDPEKSKYERRLG